MRLSNSRILEESTSLGPSPAVNCLVKEGTLAADVGLNVLGGVGPTDVYGEFFDKEIATAAEASFKAESAGVFRFIQAGLES